MDEAAQKGLVTRQRRWEARNEKRRQKALEEEAKAARIKAEDEKYMKEAIKQAKKQPNRRCSHWLCSCKRWGDHCKRL